jgi:hypothetical protein
VLQPATKKVFTLQHRMHYGYAISPSAAVQAATTLDIRAWKRGWVFRNLHCAEHLINALLHYRPGSRGIAFRLSHHVMNGGRLCAAMAAQQTERLQGGLLVLGLEPFLALKTARALKDAPDLAPSGTFAMPALLHLAQTLAAGRAGCTNLLDKRLFTRLCSLLSLTVRNLDHAPSVLKQSVSHGYC